MPAKIHLDLDLLRHLLEVEKLQQWKIAEHLGVSQTLIERTIARNGLKGQRTGPRSGEGHTGWKGGRTIRKGYWYIYSPEHPNRTKAGYVAEHRLVMEKKLGRYLLRSEVVHHRDGDPQNNVPENLEVFPTNGEHLKEELTGRIPNWSEDGKRRIAEGRKQKRRSRR